MWTPNSQPSKRHCSEPRQSAHEASGVPAPETAMVTTPFFNSATIRCPQPTRLDLRSLERYEGWPPGAESLYEAAVVEGASMQDSRSDFARVVVRIGDRWRPTDNPYVAARVTTERIEIGVHTSQCYQLIGVLGIARRARWRKMSRVAATNPSPSVAVHRGSPVRRRDRIFGTKRAGSRRRAPAVPSRTLALRSRRSNFIGCRTWGRVETVGSPS
jgi:hypothetical protein